MRRVLLLLAVFLFLITSFAFAGGNIHPTGCDYFTRDYFDWADISANIDSETGELVSITGKSWYNEVLSNISGRVYGYYLVETTNDGLVGKPTSNIGYPNGPSANNGGTYDSTKLVSYGTFPSVQNTLNDFTISSSVLNGIDINKEYHLYIWTKLDANTISFESLMGTLTKVSVNQYLTINNETKLERSFSTMGVADQKLNTDSIKLKSAVLDTQKTGTTNNVEKNETYNLYYTHVHEFTFSTDNNHMFATCNEPRCSFHNNPLDLQMIPVYEHNLLALITPDNASIKNLSWTSSSPDLLSVDQNGFVHGETPGTATVTATTTDGSNLSATCTVKLLEN